MVVTCPVCHTLIYAAEDQVGQRVACPDCDTRVLVPPPVAVEKKRPPPGVPVEEYAFREEVEGWAPGLPWADQIYVPVTCPVCKTFMQIPEDQVGQQIVCPDCRVPLVVPPPRVAADKEKHVPEFEREEYALRDEPDGSRPAAKTEEQALFPAHCPLCDSLMYVGRDQVGQRTVCGDCETSFVVPRPPEPKRKPDLRAQAGDVYGVGGSIEVPEYKPAVPTSERAFRPGVGVAADRRRRADPAGTRPPPRWTFFSGVFGFPAYRNSWSHWLGLSLGLIIPVWLGQLLMSFVMNLTGLGGDVARLVLTMLLCGITFAVGSIWAVTAFVCCLSILHDTANGYHDVENWPEALFLDWIGDFFFLICSLTVSVLPGLGIGQLLEPSGVPIWLSTSVSAVLLFPLTLLAMLETNSPLNPFSLPVWRSLLSGWWAWGLFYIETTILTAAAGGLAWLAAIEVPSPILGITLVIPLLVATMMIYFRLLGRLAWHCGGRPPREKPRPAGSDRSDEQ